ncbi:MAG: protease inhibitor I42 family protein [Patescibacteria group bacterium]|nr:protease inhibitor I42 family protein [Patescibacteria group bacterium]
MYRLFLSFLPILFLSGCFWTKMNLPQISYSAEGQNFNFEVGEEFEVVLPSNQTTGYQWEIKDITEGVLSEVKNEYRIVEEQDNKVGMPGEEVWTFMVDEIKRSHIVMQYVRPWDKTKVEDDFLITINGNPGDDGLLTFLGHIELFPADAQFDDCFVVDNGEKFGIEPYEINKVADPGVVDRLEKFGDSGENIEIRGKMIDPAIDCEGRQFIVHEIQGI